MYHWTGENFLFCFSSPSSISIGGGNGAAGLYLEDTLAHGSTGPTETFANPVLCPPQAAAAGSTLAPATSFRRCLIPRAAALNPWSAP